MSSHPGKHKIDSLNHGDAHNQEVHKGKSNAVRVNMPSYYSSKQEISYFRYQTAELKRKLQREMAQDQSSYLLSQFDTSYDPILF